MRSPTLVSPIFTIPKSLAETRLIHDLRSLNAVSSENRTFRLHGIKRALATIRPGDWLTRLDLTKGYYQVGVRPADWTLLGFIVDGRPYAFRVLPFGWKAAPFHFQRIMLEAGAVVARRFPGVNITIYLDDWLFSMGYRRSLPDRLPSQTYAGDRANETTKLKREPHFTNVHLSYGEYLSMLLGIFFFRSWRKSFIRLSAGSIDFSASQVGGLQLLRHCKIAVPIHNGRSSWLARTAGRHRWTSQVHLHGTDHPSSHSASIRSTCDWTFRYTMVDSGTNTRLAKCS
ncbi:RT-like protein [Carpediemonas membranifera]|uniref:RT-like protein n=1 Tax=Carpediemonas membranifera TaxID=201153 RepID=A0A8J6BW74_9EUKA|nr:RT-like protein [Carpediemonas membranifera]|eukprot:KAG9392151.1 RT-like protein [Carpediemonas membranifera]